MPSILAINTDQGFAPSLAVSPISGQNIPLLESNTVTLTNSIQIATTSEFTDAIKLQPIAVLTYALTNNVPITASTGPANTETWFTS